MSSESSNPPSQYPEIRKRRKSSTYSTFSEDGTEWKFPKPQIRKVSLKVQVFIASLVALVGVILVILLYPASYKCQPYQLPSRPQLKGVLAVNDVLTKAEHLLEGELNGPECLLVEGDTIYTGTEDGVIMEIRNGEIQRDIRFTDGPCGNYELEPICGRPLGIRRLNENELVVADAYLGIYTVNFETKSFKRLLEGGSVVNGRPLKFINDVEVVNENLILFTDSSSRWSRRHFLKDILEGNPTGRVLSLVPSTGKLRVLMDNLYFANGIQLFKDKKSFLVAETTMARILRHYISGPKKGTTEVFAENLPGLPDNLRLSTNGTFWVAMAAIRRKQQFSMFDFLGDKVLLREMILKLIPDHYWSTIYKTFRPRHAMIVQLDDTGNIVSTAHDLFGEVVSDISHVSDDKNYLYLGSLHANYIARVPKILE